jgi:uncharacterized protein YkwD
MKRWMMLMALMALAGGLQARAEVPASAKPAAVQQRVLQLVNEARARGRRCGNEYFASTAALIRSNQLAEAAKVHAQDMARRGYFEHEAPDGSQPKDRVRRTGYKYRLTGENIAYGPESAEEVVAGWLGSPGHCANIMDPRFRDIGVAVATGRKRGHIYWVQEFGLPAR